MIDYNGKVVLVSGGARGFGAEFARAFAAHGAAVVIGDVNNELGEKTAADIAASGASCHYVPLDVRSDSDWANITEFSSSECGGLDVVINNAGIEVSQRFVDVTVEASRNLFDINLLGVMLGIKHAFLAMSPGGSSGRGGAILNLASVAGVTSTPALAAYSASKAGVISLTKLAATEAGSLDYGVRANCLCPSLFKTDMGNQLLDEFVDLGFGESVDNVQEDLIARIPIGRFGDLSDVVNAALYLCSDAASFINGASFPVDGGMSATGG